MNIENLSKDEMRTLVSLLQKALEEPEKQAPKKRGRPKKNTATQQTAKKRGRPPKNVAEITPKTQTSQSLGPVKVGAASDTPQSELKRPPVIKQIDIGPTKNRFLDMINKSDAKKDTAIDKLLIGNNKPSPRIRKKTVKNNVRCSRCLSIYNNVDEQFVLRDEDGEYFVCPECKGGNKR